MSKNYCPWVEKYKPKNFSSFKHSNILLTNFKNNIDNFNHCILYGRAGVGKCHTINTEIIMYDGSIKMVQDIKVGDLLMGDDSTPRKVLKLGRGQDELYEISNVKGDKYGCNSEHILCLKYSGKPTLFDRKNRKSYVVSWFDNMEIKTKSKTFLYKNKNKEDILKEANIFLDNKIKIQNNYITISIKDYLKLSKKYKKELKGYKTHINFKKQEIPIDPYIIGFWLGDGSSRTCEITNQEAASLKYIKDKVKEYDCYLQHKDKYTYRINSLLPMKNNMKIKKCNNFVLKKLRELNLINNKHIPDIYKYNSRENRLKLLAGLIDSDGSYFHNTYEIIQKNNKLSEDIVYLCRSLGFACYSKKKKSYCIYKGEKRWGEYNKITIYGEELEKIPVMCLRKKSSKRKQIKNALVGGIKIKSLGKGNYYGFQLDHNHKYLLGNFIVTHNTTFINLLAKKIYKPQDLKHNVLSLNASDERGINTVREKIKIFAKQAIYKNYKYKIIILDEADSLTYEAQTALRRIIEIYSKTTRFCFICNYENKIIDPIKSRCNIIKFNNFPDKYIKEHLMSILDEEKLINQKYKDYIDIILQISNNDLRKSIIYLETLTKLNIENIDIKLIYNIFGILDKTHLKTELDTIKCFDDINSKVNSLNTYSLSDIINEITEIIIELDIDENKKYKFLILLSEIDNIKNKNVNYDIIIIKILSEYLTLIN